ncbi:hypothetical protein B0H13DRAFT_1627686, partial [Mycena leptocephala]
RKCSWTLHNVDVGIECSLWLRNVWTLELSVVGILFRCVLSAHFVPALECRAQHPWILRVLALRGSLTLQKLQREF